MITGFSYSKLIGKILLLSVVLSIFIPTALVLAIDNPNLIAIKSVRAFVGTFEAGDMLFIVEHNVKYEIDPLDDPEDTFLVGIWNESGSKGPEVRLDYYQYNISSIYLTAAQVISFGYEINDELRVRILGDPAYFSSIQEGINMRTFTLTPAHWIQGVSLSETRELLGNWCITLAEVLEEEWDIILLTNLYYLNATGRTKFEEVIPGLQTICPEIYQTSTSFPEKAPEAGEPQFEETLSGRMGERLSNVLDNFGSWLFGKEGMGTLVGGVGLAILYFILAGRIFIATGSVPGSIAVSIPFLFAGNLIGVLPLTITFIAAFLVVVAFGITFVLGRL